MVRCALYEKRDGSNLHEPAWEKLPITRWILFNMRLTLNYNEIFSRAGWRDIDHDIDHDIGKIASVQPFNHKLD